MLIMFEYRRVHNGERYWRESTTAEYESSDFGGFVPRVEDEIGIPAADLRILNCISDVIVGKVVEVTLWLRDKDGANLDQEHYIFVGVEIYDNYPEPIEPKPSEPDWMKEFFDDLDKKHAAEGLPVGKPFRPQS